ncbi:MAG: hypothetical protein LBR07_04495, partial [Puniceicoccales bacterium]|nr:hypothetical protein [Puniceicoccales bacterium]
MRYLRFSTTIAMFAAAVGISAAALAAGTLLTGCGALFGPEYGLPAGKEPKSAYAPYKPAPAGEKVQTRAYAVADPTAPFKPV